MAMALRIGGGKPAAPPLEEEIPMEEMPTEEMPEDLMSELPESLEDESAEHPHGTVDPMVAHYKDGATRQTEACGNCKYFNPDNSCQIVSGEIDPEGVCNLHASNGEAEGEPMPEGEPYPEEETPVEEEEIPEATPVDEGY